MRNRLLVLCLLAGCEKDLLADIHDASIDAPRAIDAPGTSRCIAPTTDAHPAPMYTLFVNFDGVTLTPCGTPDARTNCTSFVQQDTAIPPFLDGNAARDGFISSILYSLRKGLAPYSIDIVTVRPATGDYYMIVFGGAPAQLGLAPGFLDVAPFVCTDANRDSVSLVFDHGQAPTTIDYANTALSDMGLFAGIAAVTRNDDCLCRTGTCTIDPSKVCTYGIDVPTTSDPAFNCGRTSQDEPAMMQATYGCR